MTTNLTPQPPRGDRTTLPITSTTTSTTTNPPSTPPLPLTPAAPGLNSNPEPTGMSMRTITPATATANPAPASAANPPITPAPKSKPKPEMAQAWASLAQALLQLKTQLGLELPLWASSNSINSINNINTVSASPKPDLKTSPATATAAVEVAVEVEAGAHLKEADARLALLKNLYYVQSITTHILQSLAPLTTPAADSQRQELRRQLAEYARELAQAQTICSTNLAYFFDYIQLDWPGQATPDANDKATPDNSISPAATSRSRISIAPAAARQTDDGGGDDAGGEEDEDGETEDDDDGRSVGIAGKGTKGVKGNPDLAAATTASTFEQVGREVETEVETKPKLTRAELLKIAEEGGIASRPECLELLHLLSERVFLDSYQLQLLTGITRRYAKPTVARATLQRLLTPLVKAGFVATAPLSGQVKNGQRAASMRGGARDSVSPSASASASATKRDNPARVWYLTGLGEAYLKIHYPERRSGSRSSPLLKFAHTYGTNAVLGGLLHATNLLQPPATYSLQYQPLNWSISPHSQSSQAAIAAWASASNSKTKTKASSGGVAAGTIIPDLAGLIRLSDPTPTRLEQVLQASLIGPNLQALVQNSKNPTSKHLHPNTGFGLSKHDHTEAAVWPFFLEYDRAQEDPRVFAEKAIALARLFNAPSAWPEEWLGRFPTILVVVEGRISHIKNLLIKTRLQLKKLAETYQGNVPSSWWFTTTEGFELVYGSVNLSRLGLTAAASAASVVATATATTATVTAAPALPQPQSTPPLLPPLPLGQPNPNHKAGPGQGQGSGQRGLPTHTPIWIPLTVQGSPAVLTQHFEDWLVQLRQIAFAATTNPTNSTAAAPAAMRDVGVGMAQAQAQAVTSSPPLLLPLDVNSGELKGHPQYRIMVGLPLVDLALV